MQVSHQNDRAKYSARYGRELADHLPMALSALRRMGADAGRRDAFTAAYVCAKQLRVLDPLDPEFVARAALRSRIDRDGRVAVLSEELATLAAGIGAGAFHALIRTAYGLLDDDDDEIAAALTYWRDVALDLGTGHGGARGGAFDPERSVREAARRLAHVPATFPPRALIAERMLIVAHDPAFDGAVETGPTSALHIATIAKVAAHAFAATGNFTLLHAVTATHALRIVLPFAPDQTTLLAAFWRAFVAAFIASGAAGSALSDAADDDSREPPSWERLLLAACRSDDEHVIKAAFTAWQEDAIYNDPVYRIAVMRYMER